MGLRWTFQCDNTESPPPDFLSCKHVYFPSVSPPMVSPLVLNRALDANKADHGSLGVLGGDTGTVGAAFLSARAALMTGTGRVYVVRPSLVDGYVLDPLMPELMVIEASRSHDKPIDTWVVGPGLGMSSLAKTHFEATLGADKPLVVDADGLNLLSIDTAFAACCHRRYSGTARRC